MAIEKQNAGRSAKWCSHIGKECVRSFEIKHNLTMPPSDPTLGISPSEMGTSVHTGTCVQMFVIVLPRITPNWTLT